MSFPNTLIFVDFPSPDPAATAEFYKTGWVIGGDQPDIPEGWTHE